MKQGSIDGWADKKEAEHMTDTPHPIARPTHRVIVMCERSGIVRESFRARGCDAWSCDLEPAEDGSPYHLQQNCLEIEPAVWDLAIMHPECRYLCSSGIHWNKRRPERAAKTEAAAEFFMELVEMPFG